MLQNNAKLLNVTPVILAGGFGKRLRPLTSPFRPKPFLKAGDKNSLLQNTLLRAQHYAPPIIVTAYSYAERVFEQCYEIGVKPAAIICEPAQRNTAMAISVAAQLCAKTDQTMCVMPSDHVIEDQNAFYNAIVRATSDYKHETVMLTAKPNALSSRFGYIVSDKENKVIRFVEKPDHKTIVELSHLGAVAWNTGIFVYKSERFLKRLQKMRADLYKASRSAMETARSEHPFVFPDVDAYLSAPSVSIDYAMMEHLKNAIAFPLESKWSDIGTRKSYLEQSYKHFLNKIS